MAFQRNQSPGYVVNHLARLMANALQRRIEPLGSSTGQFPILLLLWEGDGLVQGEIGRAIGIEQPTVANTLNRMERDGLIVRSADPDDRRRAIVRLSEKGWAIRDALLAEAMAVNAAAVGGIDPVEVSIFMDVARRMIGNLGSSPEGMDRVAGNIDGNPE